MTGSLIYVHGSFSPAEEPVGVVMTGVRSVFRTPLYVFPSIDADRFADRWGFPDVEAAVAAIPEWMKKVNWTWQGVDLDKWVVSGHSNGGQGTWYVLTHR